MSLSFENLSKKGVNLIQFGNTTALLGLGLIPIIILFHLISQKTKSTIKFSMLDFIPEGKVSSKALRNSILLLLQIIGFAFLAFSWAEPQGEDNYSPKDTIILIDLSDSMNAKGSEQTKIELAKENAIDLIESSADKEYTIIGFTNDAWIISDKTDNKTLLIENINSLQTKSESSDLINSLDTVFDSGTNNYIYLITDGSYTSSDINGSIVLINEKKSSIQTVIVSNHTIERVDIKDIEIIASSSSFDISFIAESQMDSAYKSVEIVIYVDNVTYYQDNYDINNGETQIEINDISVGNAVQHRITIEIIEEDTIIGQSYAVFGNEREIKVLLCEDEFRQTDYLKAALSLEDQFNVTSTTSMQSYNIFEYDLIVLCDVPYSNFSSEINDLEQFVQEGGGILITGGSNIDASYNNIPFLPIEYVEIENYLYPGLVSYRNTSHEIISQDDGHGVIDFTGISPRYFITRPDSLIMFFKIN